MTTNIQELTIPDYERVIHATNSDTGLDCFIAIHSTKLGSAIGGSRFWQYEKTHDAIEDVLKLSKGMTYKNSLAGLNAGGGKAVINLRNVEKTPELLRSFGEVVDACNGKYLTAEDVGSSPADMQIINEITKHVLMTDRDPSPATALGVLRGMEASVNFLRQEMAPGQSLKDLHIAIQGLGHVGMALARMLHDKGATLTVTDINKDKCLEVKEKYGASVVEPDDIYDIECDIFAPCALGGSVNKETVERLRCKILCGAANNQLCVSMVGYALKDKGIIYVPDFLVNAGGVIDAYKDFSRLPSDFHVANMINGIYDRALICLKIAADSDVPTNLIAEQMAEKRLK
jgi:leucine dehydrogenase